MPRAVVVTGLLVALGGCGGGSPARPTPPPSQDPTTPPAEWTLAGQVVTTLSGEPVSGARVKAGDSIATTGTDGRFELRRSTRPQSPLTLTVERDGFLTRETAAAHPRSSPLTIDVIAQHSPFNLTFYRELARDAMRSTVLEELWPWTRDAVFYVQTVDDTGRNLEPEVLAQLRKHIPAAFVAWTNGSRGATLEEGTMARPDADGMVRVRFTRSGKGSCAMATVGGNRGWIEFNVDRCGCGSLKIDPMTIWHEVGHTAGFFHVSERKAVLSGDPFPGSCESRVQLLDAEQHHARVAYTRPRGNMDPDRDPAAFTFLQGAGRPRRVVSCGN